MQKILASLALVALASTAARGAELEHLLNPPPGTVLFDLVSEASVAPLDFVGTIDPPNVLMNGKALTLTEFHPDATTPPVLLQGSGPALWMNAVAQPTSDEVGRFFVELSGAAAAVASMDIVLRTREARYFRARAEINRTFLDAPFRSRVRAGAGQKDRFPFTLTGKIPPGSQLLVEDAKSLSQDDDEVTFTIELPLGRSVIAARLRQPDGSVRLISIPVRAKRSEPSPGAPVLSLEVPDGSKAYEPWELKSYGARTHGFVNEGATLTVDGERASVDDLGRFAIDIDPPRQAWTTHFDVRTRDGQQATADKPMRCESCDKAPAWYRPRPRRPDDSYVFAPLVSFGNFRAQMNDYITRVFPALGAGYGRYLSSHFFTEASLVVWPSTEQTSTGSSNGQTWTQTVKYGSATILEAKVGYQPISLAWIAMGLRYVHCGIQSITNGGGWDVPTSKFGPFLSFGLRFRLSKSFDLAPRFSLRQISGDYAALGGADIFEPFVLRYYF